MRFGSIDGMRDLARPVCKNDDTDPHEEFIDAMEEVVEAAPRARIAALKLPAKEEPFEAILVNAREAIRKARPPDNATEKACLTSYRKQR
jgi:hypothetical protein